MNARAVLECQTCGKLLRLLTPAERERVAADPHRFIIDCVECRKARGDW